MGPVIWFTRGKIQHFLCKSAENSVNSCLSLLFTVIIKSDSFWYAYVMVITLNKHIIILQESKKYSQCLMIGPVHSISDASSQTTRPLHS